MKWRKFRLAPWVAACAFAACGPSLAADQVRVVPDGQRHLWWQADPISPNHPPPYFAAALHRAIEGCMAVAFLIRSDGSISNERVWRDTVRAFPERSDMEQSVLQTVHRWRFVPAPANAGRAPVYTYAIFNFRLSDPAPWEARHQTAKCRIADFAQEVKAMAEHRQTGDKP